MAQFGRGGRSGGGNRGGFRAGEKRGFGGRDRDSRPVEMHEAICSNCNKRCEVPFRPTGERPVYCKDCFAGSAAPGSERFERHERRNFSGSAPSRAGGESGADTKELKRQLEGVNTRLERLISAVQTLTEVQKAKKAVYSEKTTEKKASASKRKTK